MRPGEEVIRFAAYGVAVAVAVRHACPDGGCAFPALAVGVRGMLPPGAVESEGNEPGAHTIEVSCDGNSVCVAGTDRDVAVCTSLPDALHAVDQTIRSTIAVHAPGLVFIHAGAVAHRGRVIVLPGTSMAGKTTLVAELVRAGAAYLSDEYAVFDADGLVHPFARRLSVREPTGRREVPVAEFGGTTVTEPLPAGLIAAVSFDTAADAEWQVRIGDQAGCARALIANAVAAQIRSAEVLSVAARVARSTPFVEGTRGEAARAAAHLLESV